jgi:hypothetical protein
MELLLCSLSLCSLSLSLSRNIALSPHLSWSLSNWWSLSLAELSQTISLSPNSLELSLFLSLSLSGNLSFSEILYGSRCVPVFWFSFLTLGALVYSFSSCVMIAANITTSAPQTGRGLSLPGFSLSLVSLSLFMFSLCFGQLASNQTVHSHFAHCLMMSVLGSPSHTHACTLVRTRTPYSYHVFLPV